MKKNQVIPMLVFMILLIIPAVIMESNKAKKRIYIEVSELPAENAITALMEFSGIKDVKIENDTIISILYIRHEITSTDLAAHLKKLGITKEISEEDTLIQHNCITMPESVNQCSGCPSATKSGCAKNNN